MGVRDAAGAFVERPLLLAAPDEDVPQAAGHEGRIGERARRLDECQELAGKRPAPEREQLHHDHRRAPQRHGLEDRPPPEDVRPLDRPSPVRRYEPALAVPRQRRELDELDAGRHGHVARDLAAAQDHDVEPL